MKPEQLANAYFRDKARAAGWMTQRHEDKISTGIPDISFVSPCSDGWIEMKATTGDRALKIRIAQVNWLCDRSRFAHFSGYMLCRADKKWLVAQIAERDRDFLMSGKVKPSTWSMLTRPFVTSDINLILRWMDMPW